MIFKYRIPILLIAFCAAACTGPPVLNPTRPSDSMVQDRDEGRRRGSTMVRLKMSDGQIHGIKFTTPPPAVQGNLINIFAGETLYIEAEESGNHLVNLRAVQTISNPNSTLSFCFYQDPKIADGTAMLLIVESPFVRPIKYHLAWRLHEGQDFQKTSSCPVRGGVKMVEMWPHPMSHLTIIDMRSLDPNSEEARICQY